ncbi:hypothetical protein CEXT_59821 [Caerostris extrusa]|uniref:Uncharacterized protein n=1 Tax=Caerostris extrusa TaxID=172846 RepID=A0AAV4XX59_CAEEX|nr:hypothetical protein CEXT_59821 [Caerostris extrusa]
MKNLKQYPANGHNDQLHQYAWAVSIRSHGHSRDVHDFELGGVLMNPLEGVFGNRQRLSRTNTVSDSNEMIHYINVIRRSATL